jgi:nucleotidyltransferase substrate binding protein (TIGR01987 family)
MTKAQSLFSDLKKAIDKLEQAALLPASEINRDATIKRFEFCFELCWKLMQAILQENGIEAYGPKGSIREAAKLGLIDNPQTWLEFLKARNLTTHTYEEKLAEKVYNKVKKFNKTAEVFIKNAEKFLKT